jgi:PAT family beta-lactamase induction signal transducer AmpG
VKPPASFSNPSWRHATVAALYGQQGLAAGFATVAVPNLYAAEGASVAQVAGHLAAVGLPWILQPLWGPVVDANRRSRMGPRRGWVLLALAASVSALLLLALLAGERPALPLVTAILAAQAAAAALQDTATDGLIMDNTPEGALGGVSATTRAGIVTGTLAGGAGFSWLLPALGVGGTAAVVAGLSLLLGAVPLLARERPGDALLSLRRIESGRVAPLAALLRELGRELARPGNLALFLFCFAQDFAGALLQAPLGVALLHGGGWSAEGLSTLQGAVTFLGGTVGALLAGWWTDRSGSGRTLPALIGLAAIASLLAAPMLGMLGVAAAGPFALSLANITSVLSFVALAPAVMAASRGPVGATRFTLYMAALNAGGVGGAAVSADASAALGLPATALVAGLVLAVAALSARAMLRLAAREAALTAEAGRSR